MARFARNSRTRASHKPPTEAPAEWDTLLQDAVNKPGTLAAAFRAFPDYSIGNQLLAMFQFHALKMPVEPIATYKRWAALGRQVRTGEKAKIILCAPRTFFRKPKDGDDDSVRTAGVYFTYGRWWFPMSSTDGPDVTWPTVAGWDAEAAISNLKLRRVPFEYLDGNTQGYSFKNTVAVSPLATDPAGTLIHELAHAVLHQKDAGEIFLDGPDQPRNLREVEAESVALILSEVLGLGHQSDHRGYVQHWLRGGSEIPAANSQRVFSAANTILKAGRAVVVADESEDEPELELAA